METITAYKLTDGSIVENQREAITKQNYLNFETKINIANYKKGNTS
jgi:hypothetical protein